MKKMEYVLTDKEGIHARPGGLLVKKANEFDSAIQIQKGDKTADAKRIFGVMGLGAKCGEEIVITAEGPDEAEAITAMQTLLTENL